MVKIKQILKPLCVPCVSAVNYLFNFLPQTSNLQRPQALIPFILRNPHEKPSVCICVRPPALFNSSQKRSEAYLIGVANFLLFYL